MSQKQPNPPPTEERPSPPPAPPPKQAKNIVYLSGERCPIHVAPGDRRFLVVLDGKTESNT